MEQRTRDRRKNDVRSGPGGIAGWVLGKLARDPKQQPRLEVLERIALAPRHSLALVEADGRRLLVATSAESGPVFYALDAGRSRNREGSSGSMRRISW
jgi:hypothetical protein